MSFSKSSPVITKIYDNKRSSSESYCDSTSSKESPIFVGRAMSPPARRRMFRLRWALTAAGVVTDDDCSEE